MFVNITTEAVWPAAADNNDRLKPVPSPTVCNQASNAVDTAAGTLLMPCE